MRQTCFVATLTAVAWLALAPAAWGQQASGIAGLVRDTSGAVLPGVTVEAASPALIEKVRSAVTDSQGRYNIVDLRPGTYIVTFALAGFNMLKREGVELTAGFTATINADLQVGALEETVTVTGQSPLVDVQNVKQQRVDLRRAAVGAASALESDGIARRDHPGHGGCGRRRWQLRHLHVEHHVAQHVSRQGRGEVPVRRDADEQHGRARGDQLRHERRDVRGDHGRHRRRLGGEQRERRLDQPDPKQGANTFRTEFFGFYTGEHLQSDNLDDELRARGLTTGPKALGIYDFNGTSAVLSRPTSCGSSRPVAYRRARFRCRACSSTPPRARPFTRRETRPTGKSG